MKLYNFIRFFRSSPQKLFVNCTHSTCKVKCDQQFNLNILSAKEVLNIIFSESLNNDDVFVLSTPTKKMIWESEVDMCFLNSQYPKLFFFDQRGSVTLRTSFEVKLLQIEYQLIFIFLMIFRVLSISLMCIADGLSVNSNRKLWRHCISWLGWIATVYSVDR